MNKKDFKREILKFLSRPPGYWLFLNYHPICRILILDHRVFEMVFLTSIKINDKVLYSETLGRILYRFGEIKQQNKE